MAKSPSATENETKNACAIIHPALLPYIEQCLSNDALNTQGGILEVRKPRPSTLEFNDGKTSDRFTVGIPYCGTQIHWEVIFDRNHPYHPPDVIFSAEDDFNPDIEQLSSLSEWSRYDPNCLCKLLEELLAEYRKHQREKISLYQRLNFELNTLMQSALYSNVDVHCSKSKSSDSKQNSTEQSITRFYIPLQIDFSAIPTYLTRDNPGPDLAALMVTFHSPNGTRVIPSLFLSPRVERMLGGTSNLRLPQWGGEKSSYLMDYVPMVHSLLEEKVLTIIQSYVQRKEYTAACLSILGKAVLEYDTQDFKTLCFLFEDHGFSFISKLTLSDEFPQEQPTLTLQSVYHRFKGIPCLSIVNAYPYSPRWSAEEMAERMRTYIISIVQQFRELSTDKGECL